ncbi:MAG: TonB-dependent receptor plug domain-containing protein, partial [Sphingobacterium siyangense]
MKTTRSWFITQKTTLASSLLVLSFSIIPAISFSRERPIAVKKNGNDQESGTIKGKVKNSEGKGLSNVYVNIDGINSAKTDHEGNFIFSKIPKGIHSMTVKHIGFQEIKSQIALERETLELPDFVMEQTSNHLNEVVVTASRLAESIDEVPSSITYIGGKTLEDQRLINDNLPNILMQKVPSISPSEESQNNFIAKIRGRNFLVLIDGIPQSTPLRNGGRDMKTIDASAIDHIEVINGASALYGNGAAGGIINYITKKPKTDRSFHSSTS